MQHMALDELNFYRKLLQMDPLTSMDAFKPSADHAIVEPSACLGPITRSAAFETMPPEILDRIVQFVDGKSIQSLCHAIPYCKYISTAMFDFAHRFPKERYTPSKLWPDMYFPKFKNTESKKTDFPIQHMHAAGVYSRIISKHGGNVLVPCSKDVFNYLGALPEVLSVFPGDINTSSAWAAFLRQLADSNKRIRSCTVRISLLWGGELPVVVQEALPRISGLEYLQVDRPRDAREQNSFSRCVNLEELSFARLMYLENPVGLVDRILRRIKGSRIRKVWHADHIQSLHQRALGKLNFYRKLLQLHPLTSMDAFRTSRIQPTSCIGSINRSASFETMPPEILNRIVQYVDSKSILPLCHSLPYYKYISRAMFDFARPFPNERYTPSELWPDMQLPIFQNEESETTEFPIKHLQAAKVYSRIISKHCGNVHVPCSKNALNYLDALPDAVFVCPGDDSSPSGWTKFLHGLADANKQIISCTVIVSSDYYNWCEVAHQLKRLQVPALIWNDEDYFPTGIEEALPFISGLKYLEVYSPREMPNGTSLSRCLDLEEISFSQLLYEDTEDLVEGILEEIKGSRIRKVSCKIPATTKHYGPATFLKALKTISSDFLKHGWHKELQSDGRKSNAGGSQSSADADRVVMAYLRERGYKNAEAALNADTKGAVSSGSQIHSQNIEASIPDFLLFYSETEANNPNAYQHSYARLCRWVKDSLEKYRVRFLLS
ncbi:hypothetical protein CcCBS67573_g09525 [Chytriomyces confervae]|uniref:Uncharacterized protein n=1 Tax=Chytriomyces confervae TaxID=246404 RepID=A0A507DVD6_9FUNG|nr:hypothetical protein CcCBS67573_g09525 [Chytriomyces confervae]